MLKNKKTFISWAFYEWANSSISVIIETFVFAAYFVKSVASNPAAGSAQWGFINAIAAILVAITGPLLGAIADNSGNRKIWLGIFTLICILTTASLWFVAPSNSYAALGLVLVCIVIFTSETALIFYNAMLPELAEPGKLGTWSGWGWAAGYAGGLLCLLLALLFITKNDGSDSIRNSFLLAAGWYAIFSIPLFLYTPATHGKNLPLTLAIKHGFINLWNTFQNVRKYSLIARFLIARMFFLDGITTIFIFGGIYAAVTFGMSDKEVLLFGITLNIAAGLGAAAFAPLDDWLGSKKVIMISIVGLIIPTVAILLTNDRTTFWILGLFLGIFVGPVQSASRTFFSRIIPEHLRNEMFGFFAFSAKATAFIGPTLVGWLILLTGSQRIGLSIIVVFLMIGGFLLHDIQDRQDRQDGQDGQD